MANQTTTAVLRHFAYQLQDRSEVVDCWQGCSCLYRWQAVVTVRNRVGLPLGSLPPTTAGQCTTRPDSGWRRRGLPMSRRTLFGAISTRIPSCTTSISRRQHGLRIRVDRSQPGQASLQQAIGYYLGMAPESAGATCRSAYAASPDRLIGLESWVLRCPGRAMVSRVGLAASTASVM